MIRFLPPAFLSLLAASLFALPARADSDKVSMAPARIEAFGSVKRLYANTSKAVVAITCRTRRGQFFGTGAIIDPSGIVLTSVTVVPPGAVDIQIYSSGGRVARGRSIADNAAKEFALVRIRRPERLVPGGGAVPYLKLGDSRGIKIGDSVFTLGNSFHSIEQDDQVTIAAGIVSGIFELREKRSESTYLGRTIETSAALNNGMDGGPLVDAQGRIIGLLSLNYSRSRWLGTAVPVSELKPLIARHRGWFDDRYPASGAGMAKTKNRIGWELEEIAGKNVHVLSLKSAGPAEKAGIRAGDRVLGIGGKNIVSVKDFVEAFGALPRAGKVKILVERDKKKHEYEVRLWGRF